MARIRSIKPEFFTSEAIAALPLSARLTFIGLWTYVDDNGVGLDNERLIIAAVWPLEEDLAEVVRRTREDLRRLSGVCLVTRYADGARRLIHIRSWEEHQKVSHPRKPRYPLPTDPVTSTNGTLEGFGRHSRGLPETLRPEQGAGSREGSREQGSTGALPPVPPDSQTLPSGNPPTAEPRTDWESIELNLNTTVPGTGHQP